MHVMENILIAMLATNITQARFTLTSENLFKFRIACPITTKLVIIFYPCFSPVIILEEFGCTFLMSVCPKDFLAKHTIGYVMELVGPIDMKKATTSNRCWADCVTSIFYLIHDLDLVFSRSNFEITVCQELVVVVVVVVVVCVCVCVCVGGGGGGGLIYMELKEYE